MRLSNHSVRRLVVFLTAVYSAAVSPASLGLFVDVELIIVSSCGSILLITPSVFFIIVSSCWLHHQFCRLVYFLLVVTSCWLQPQFDELNHCLKFLFGPIQCVTQGHLSGPALSSWFSGRSYNTCSAACSPRPHEHSGVGERVNPIHITVPHCSAIL